MPARKTIRVFVASSSEQSPVASRIAGILRRVPGLQVDAWNQGVFKFSATYIESLEAELDRADSAVFVMTGDDRAHVRGRKVLLPRDNLNFELGLFTGRLGRDRCIFFVDRFSRTSVASDLAGVEAASFYLTRRHGSPPGQWLSSQVRRAAKQIVEAGPRYKPAAGVREAQQALWRFSNAVAGFWWERIRSHDDDKSALSYVSMGVDEVTTAPTMEGWAYGLRGEPLADWRSLSTGVLLGSRPRVYYRWQGQHEDEIGQIYGGGGHIDFDARLSGGEGQFYDTNFARLKKTGSPTRVKRFRMLRATARDAEIMQDLWSADAAALIRRKLQATTWRR